MNKAARTASGEYLAFLNTDDFYHDTNSLAELLKLLQQQKPDYAFASLRWVRRNGKIKTDYPNIAKVFRKMPYCHQTLLVKRTCFLEMGGYDTAFRIIGDHEFAIRLYLENRSFLIWRKPFVTYRSGGLSRDKAKNHLERTVFFKKLYSPFYPASEEAFSKMASGGKFPFPLFRALLKRARPCDRPAMILNYFFSK